MKYLDKYVLKLRKNTSWKCGNCQKVIIANLRRNKQQYFFIILVELNALYSRKQIAESVMNLAQRGIIELVKVL